MEIPLALIDTQDGPAVTLAGPGSLLNFALAVTDNDQEMSRAKKLCLSADVESNDATLDRQRTSLEFRHRTGAKMVAVAVVSP